MRPTRRQREGYIHIWRYVGCLVGVPEELSPGSEDEGMALVRVGRICEPPPEVDSIIMAHTIVNSAAMALGVYDIEEKRRRLEFGQTRDVRYFTRAAEMVLSGGKLRCGRCGNHGSGEVWRPPEHRGEGAAPADDQGRQEFRPGHHQGPYSAENGRGLERISSGRCPGHLGADRFRAKRRYAEEGLDEVLQRRNHVNRYRKLDDRSEAHLIALACSPAPEGHDHWTLRLLAGKAVELGLVESLSHETVRLRMKKTRSSRGGSSNGASRG